MIDRMFWIIVLANYQSGVGNWGAITEFRFGRLEPRVGVGYQYWSVKNTLVSILPYYVVPAYCHY